MFHKGFTKVAVTAPTGFFNDAKKLDYAGLGLLATVPAYHAYKAVKNKDKETGALSAAELGGLGLLARSVHKAH